MFGYVNFFLKNYCSRGAIGAMSGGDGIGISSDRIDVRGVRRTHLLASILWNVRGYVVHGCEHGFDDGTVGIEPCIGNLHDEDT